MVLNILLAKQKIYDYDYYSKNKSIKKSKPELFGDIYI